ncbi:MAG: peptidase M20, partial [Acidimicrobiaceae bacterium]|nr:peptidase M20 [Acidimicrobiaceae bacterium]
EVIVEAEAPAQGWLAPEPTAWVRDALDSASMEAFSRPVGFCGEGGSIPFLATLGSKFPLAQIVATGALGPGSNHHGPDESLRIPMAVAVSTAVAHLLSNAASSKS